MLQIVFIGLLIGQLFAQQFQLFDDAAGEVRFRLRAANGEIVLASEGYTQKQGAIAGTSAVRIAAADADNFVVKETSNAGQYYFVLKAGNSAVVGVSEVYVSKANAEAGAVAAATAAAAATKIVGARARFVRSFVVTTKSDFIFL
jgi:uncharacterized protein YegP (UPF0339 family)